MKVIEPGHIYQLQHLDGTGAGTLMFVNREAGTEHEGTQTQEVLRALIDRTQHCDRCLRWDGNDKIIQHLRMALALHESRAIERKTEKGVIEPEKVPVAADGHFEFREVMPAEPRTIALHDVNYIHILAQDMGMTVSALRAELHLVGLEFQHMVGIDLATARAIVESLGFEWRYTL